MKSIDASPLSWWDMSPEAIREKINQRIANIEAPTPTVKSATNHVVNRNNRNTPIRIYTPTQGNHFPLVVLIHGGAWVAGNDDLRDAGQKYADRLHAAGVPTHVYCQKNIGHLAGDGAKASFRARESLNVAVAAIQNAF